MPSDQFKAFWDAVQADPSLQQKLTGVTDLDAVAVIASEAGFTITAEEIQQARDEFVELNDDDLDRAAGGDELYCCWASRFS